MGPGVQGCVLSGIPSQLGLLSIEQVLPRPSPWHLLLPLPSPSGTNLPAPKIRGMSGGTAPWKQEPSETLSPRGVWTQTSQPGWQEGTTTHVSVYPAGMSRGPSSRQGADARPTAGAQR